MKKLATIAALALLFIAGDAAAQCPLGSCPVAVRARGLFRGRTTVKESYSYKATAVAPVLAAPVVVAKPAVAVVVTAPQPVGAVGDRLKAKLQAEAGKLIAEKERTGKLTPEQWEKLFAIIELLLKIFGTL